MSGLDLDPLRPGRGAAPGRGHCHRLHWARCRVVVPWPAALHRGSPLFLQNRAPHSETFRPEEDPGLA